MWLEFCQAIEYRIHSARFEKETAKITYKSGGAAMYVDFIIMRRNQTATLGNCINIV